MTLVDLVEIVGSLLILAAFLAAQLGRLSPRSPSYLALNLAGSSVLAVIALLHGGWGFLLLEGTWAVVSGSALVARARARLTGR
jgi:membrane-bound ClpP family serine protease